jgi:hypothetical protein
MRGHGAFVQRFGHWVARGSISIPPNLRRRLRKRYKPKEIVAELRQIDILA